MAVTAEQVRAVLAPEEPDYAAAAALGADALPHLSQLITGDNLEFAVKAASLASQIPDDRSVDVALMAAQSPHVLVRVAVAAGLPSLTGHPIQPVVATLLNDADRGVRRLALEAARPVLDDPEVLGMVQRAATRDPAPEIRGQARELLSPRTRGADD
jgi:S-adenosylmethionine:diacylglycerol 3-amino-3-carboxypropyl transferase